MSAAADRRHRVASQLGVAGGALGVDNWKDTTSVVTMTWLRCLLSFTGASELLMAAGATPVHMVVGAVGGIALIAASWLRSLPRLALSGLVIVGTVPFAALAWTAVVPVLLLLAAAAVAVPLVQAAGRA